MSTAERRMAAQANQRAAAFTRFQVLGDHEAMHVVLSESEGDLTERLAFITALASIAGSVAISAMGRERTLSYLRTVAESSAALSHSDDIDRYFDTDG
jgi:hypothetical protein